MNSSLYKNVLLLLLGIITSPFSPTQTLANERAAFIKDMTDAYYAVHGLCKGYTLNVDGMIAAAKAAGVSGNDHYMIENAILRLNGSTKVPIPPKDIEKSVYASSVMISADLSKFTKEDWCEFRIPNLKRGGFISPAK